MAQAHIWTKAELHELLDLFARGAGTQPAPSKEMRAALDRFSELAAAKLEAQRERSSTRQFRIIFRTDRNRHETKTCTAASLADASTLARAMIGSKFDGGIVEHAYVAGWVRKSHLRASV